MANIGTAYVQIVPSAQGISGKIQQQLGGSAVGQRAGAQIGKGMIAKIGGIVAAAGIGTMIVKGISASIKEGAALEQSLGGVETLFKNNAKKVIQNADQAYRTAGMSANEYMENVTSFSASLLQSLGGDTEKAADSADMALRDMSDNSNKFGTDMGRITDAYQGFAKQNYTMLDNLKLGYGGTKSEMQRLLSDAEKFSGVHYDINNLDDVYNAIHVIQEEMGVTGTTAKEASQTLSGSFASMKAAGKNLLANLALGRDIAPSVKALAETASTFLFDNLLPAIGNILKQLPTAIKVFFQTGAPQLATAALELLKSLGQSIVKNAPILFQKLSEGLSKALSKMASWNPAETSATGSSLMGKIAQALVDNLPKIMKAVSIISLKLLALLAVSIPKLGVKITLLLTRLIGQIAARAVAAVGARIQYVFRQIRFRIGAKINEIRTSIVTKVAGIRTAIAAGVKNIWRIMTSPFTTAKQKIDEIIRKIKGVFPLSIGKMFSDLSLPHFKIVKKGKFPWGVGGKGNMPEWDVKWFAKGGIFDSPTIAGLGDVKGGEAALPLAPFWAKMDEIIDAVGTTREVVINVYAPEGASVREIAKEVKREFINEESRRRLAW